MIPCIVPDQDGILAPLFILVVERLDQLCQEQHHGVLVGVGLEKSCVELALTIKSYYQSDSRAHLFCWKTVVNALALPTPPSVVCRVDPGFVDVDKLLAPFQKLQKLKSTLLSLNEAPL